VLTALDHREPDRVPLDLGGTESSSMTAAAYNALKRHLALPEGCRVFDPIQHIVLIEDAIRERFGIATYPIVAEPARWRPGRLPDGSPCQLPEGWRTEVRADGSEEAIGPRGNVIARRAASGHHFDRVNPPLARVESAADLAKHPEAIARFDYPAFADESIERMVERAREGRKSGRAAVFSFPAHLLAAGQNLRGFDTFMMDLVLDRALADALLTELVDAYCHRADEQLGVLGDLVDVVMVCDDLGTQLGPMLAPELYRKTIRPHQRRLFAHLKSYCPRLLMHSCGSVRWVIPDLIEIGVDALNPVQVSAAEMDTAGLKRDFGRDLTFWGGGCDTQRVLSCGSESEVRDEVKRRIGDLAPGGGFVFCQVHNIQPEVPPQNVVAMLEAVEEFGG
jgi:uroporphyrinogen decarboxylase